MMNPMSPRVGIYLADQQLTVAASSRRGGTQCFAVELGDTPGARLKMELDTRQLRLRRVRFGLSRALATVKALDLPPAAGNQLTGMVAFELERHVPFPPEEVRFDYTLLPGTPTAPSRVLVTACERRTVEGALRLLEESRLKPAALTVACHDLPTLLGRGSRGGFVVWAHRAGSAIDLVCLAKGRLHLSRAVPATGEEALASDIEATLALLGWADCDAIWLSGDETDTLLVSPALASLAGSVGPPPWSAAAAALLGDLPGAEIGRATLALATALGSRRPELNLLPVELRPRTFSTGQLVTAGTVSVTALLALGLVLAQGYKQHRYAAKLSDAIHQLDPEVKTVERLSAELAQKKRLLEAVRALEKGDVRALPIMRELADKLPQDAWLRTFTMDKQGLEITGQAAAANQLIPLLENSPSLTRVEFTAPVTKAGDKEQFRIKAAWKNSPAPETPAVAAPGPKPPTPAPGAPPSSRPPAARPSPSLGR
jgi:Tfp pilus assembly protein PilN